MMHKGYKMESILYFVYNSFFSTVDNLKVLEICIWYKVSFIGLITKKSFLDELPL